MLLGKCCNHLFSNFNILEQPQHGHFGGAVNKILMMFRVFCRYLEEEFLPSFLGIFLAMEMLLKVLMMALLGFSTFSKLPMTLFLRTNWTNICTFTCKRFFLAVSQELIFNIMQTRLLWNLSSCLVLISRLSAPRLNKYMA